MSELDSEVTPTVQTLSMVKNIKSGYFCMMEQSTGV